MIIRDLQAFFAMTERGQLSQDFLDQINSTLKALSQMSRDNPRGSFKAKVTLELTLTVEDGGEQVLINPKVPAPKLPELKRRSTAYFLTEDGEMSTEHPQQFDMIGGPREIVHNR